MGCLWLTANMQFGGAAPVFSKFLAFDEISFLIGILTVLVVLTRFFFTKVDSRSSFMSYFLLLVCCLIVFFSNEVFLLYCFYEFSLVPIIFIILIWGSYAERSLGCLLLLVYTTLFSLPFMCILFLLWVSLGRLSVGFLRELRVSVLLMPELVTYSIFLTFAVKLPIFGLHHWLPVAHVEAPTAGSMLLAGVLLKLGGVGLLRLSFLLNKITLSNTVTAYVMVFMLYSAIICCYQQDFKRLVAYSSVFHIIIIPLLLVSFYGFSDRVILMLMYVHGIRSPVLFSLVGVLYSMLGSRQLVLFRGLIGVSPLLSFVAICVFFINISAPPFPGFLREVLSFVCCYRLTPLMGFILVFLPLLNLLYRLN